MNHTTKAIALALAFTLWPIPAMLAGYYLLAPMLYTLTLWVAGIQ